MLKPASKAAMDLLMAGSVAMSRIEGAGLRIDLPYLRKAIADTRKKIEEKRHSIKESKEHKAWQRLYGNDMKLGSKAQLGRVIFGEMGHKRNPFLGQKNNVAAFEHLKCQFIRDYQDVERLKKALSTNLLGIYKEQTEGYLHPFFDLHTTLSWRSSSSRINFQNQPVRNKDISQIVRTCIIPRPGNVFLEMDYGSQEVRVSACYNQDPKLIEYILEGGDMHYDRALELYMLTPEEMGDGEMAKLIRYVAKNKFVFAEFYGDYYGHCAPNLWDSISLMNLQTAGGVSLFEHLKAKGIESLGKCDPDESPKKGTYEAHVQEVERHMWEDVFTVYHQWKKDWWNLYLRQGGVNFLTGFKMEGVFRRNQILCCPIQGSAFHCLLWSIIQIQKVFIKYKMKTKIVAQVHDSLLLDTPRGEIKNVVEIVTKISTTDVAKHWKWITVPLMTEWEICESNWGSKQKLKVAV